MQLTTRRRGIQLYVEPRSFLRKKLRGSNEEEFFSALLSVTTAMATAALDRALLDMDAARKAFEAAAVRVSGELEQLQVVVISKYKSY